jgi:hypothetical protein
MIKIRRSVTGCRDCAASLAVDNTSTHRYCTDYIIRELKIINWKSWCGAGFDINKWRKPMDVSELFNNILNKWK